MNSSLARRFWRYQAERFPLVSFVPLISLFTFSSVAFSRLSRDVEGFIPWPRILLGCATSVFCFFLLRVLDEHKDAADDARYRPELPVPRGLIALSELRRIAWTIGLILLALNLWIAPRLVWAMSLVAIWVFLMTKEFFVRDWLRAHVAAYLLTHMAVMPFIDVYTTGLDWLVAGAKAAPALGLFLAVTFFNGILIEIGRKLRAPADEREGVDSYTRAWGLRAAPLVWLLALFASATAAAKAAEHVMSGALAATILFVAALACAIPAILFCRQAQRGRAKAIDLASGLWPFVTYLLLGTGPYLLRTLFAGTS